MVVIKDGYHNMLGTRGCSVIMGWCCTALRFATL